MTLCGNAGGLKFETTVLPFILRAVKLIGIDSVQYPIMERSAIWEKFTQNWQEVTEIPINEIKLNDVVKTIEQLKQGNHLGRTIVKIQD
jgi:NADPH:quinone reductase-like Zn-dependent oxidoreductase